MFQNDRFITIGIQQTLHPIHCLLLWELLDNMELDKKDYLQVFNIKVKFGKRLQVEIEHTQEQPEYRGVYRFQTNIAIENMKVWVIDDGTVTTMLLPTEY